MLEQMCQGYVEEFDKKYVRFEAMAVKYDHSIDHITRFRDGVRRSSVDPPTRWQLLTKGADIEHLNLGRWPDSAASRSKHLDPYVDHHHVPANQPDDGTHDSLCWHSSDSC